MAGAVKYQKKPGGYCFVAGTLVLKTVGLVKIENIQSGDMVYAKEAVGEEQSVDVSQDSELAPVLEVYSHEVDETYVVTVDGESIETTANHPFYDENGEQVEAKDLEEGDEISTANGDTATVDSVECIHHDEPVMVYNFCVMEDHTYFVGECGVLVHNQCDGSALDGFEKRAKGISEKITEPGKTESYYYHSCADEVADIIAESGFRTDLPNPQAAFNNNRFGRGVYLADSPTTALAERPGGTILKVEAKLGKNLDVTSRGIIGGDDYSMAHAIARGARKHGYDSITFMSSKNKTGINTVIFNPNNVTVKEIMR
jgi:intein/homing endonuclease